MNVVIVNILGISCSNGTQTYMLQSLCLKIETLPINNIIYQNSHPLAFCLQASFPFSLLCMSCHNIHPTIYAHHLIYMSKCGMANSPLLFIFVFTKNPHIGALILPLLENLDDLSYNGLNKFCCKDLS